MIRSKSYPYLAIAKHYQVPYEVVLNYAQWARGPRLLGLAPTASEQRACDWLKVNMGMGLSALLNEVDEACQDFRRIQREGW